MCEKTRKKVQHIPIDFLNDSIILKVSSCQNQISKFSIPSSIIRSLWKATTSQHLYSYTSQNGERVSGKYNYITLKNLIGLVSFWFFDPLNITYKIKLNFEI